MANTKISGLAAADAAAAGDEFVINKAGTNKKLTAQQLLDLVSANQQLIVKETDENAANSATLHEDADMHFELPGDACYFIEGRLIYLASAAAGFKFDALLDGNGLPYLYMFRTAQVSGNLVHDVWSGSSVTVEGQGANIGDWTEGVVLLSGACVNELPDPTEFILRWAQGTQDNSNCYLRKGSYLRITKHAS